MDPPTSSLIFANDELPSFSRTLHSHRAATLSISNRLSSITVDSRFVLSVSKAYNDRPLIANERCGSWYIPPSAKEGSAYFKSTDGHMGEWAFSTRRMNTHVLELVGQRDGLVVVDSTRRGKSGFPTEDYSGDLDVD
jgi:tRNA A64-2'-O-ribosylphosphate transferase